MTEKFQIVPSELRFAFQQSAALARYPIEVVKSPRQCIDFPLFRPIAKRGALGNTVDPGWMRSHAKSDAGRTYRR